MTADKRSSNRRADLIEAAIEAFIEKGYEGTSVADLVTAVGMSKAAFGYHFESKEALLVELAEPLLSDLEKIDARAEPTTAFISEYLDLLLRHADLVAWIDGDRFVLSHPDVGARLDRHLATMRRDLTGDEVDSEVRGSMALASMWRPIRNLDLSEVADYRASMVRAVLAILTV